MFADSHFWVAILNDHDQSHSAAQVISQSLQGTPTITTEEVLTEVLAYFSDRGPHLRRSALTFVEALMRNPSVLVKEQSHQTFISGLALYKARPDMGYRLTNCIAMDAMRREGVAEIMTHDDHFTQEGFTILL